jgi:nicotinamidase-related amidase
MPVDLATLVDPATTAVLTVEVQRGVIGDLSAFPQLRTAADRVGVVANTERLTGVSPFFGTALDTWLRNLGVTTVVATGVSVNLGVLGLVIEAANHGYQVVVPRDSVAGIPTEYAEAVLDNTFPLVATLTTVGAVVEAWEGLLPHRR